MTVKGKRQNVKYCSQRCRQAAYRKRNARTDLGATLGHCVHCGGGFFASGKGSTNRKYCSPSCRTLASRARRNATVDALAQLGMGQGKAADVLETEGLVKLARYLSDIGFEYDQTARCWHMPATLPALVSA